MRHYMPAKFPISVLNFDIHTIYM